MKARRIIIFMLALVMFLTPVLGMAQAADVATRTAELSGIKITDLPKYETKVPTNGTKKTEKDYHALLTKYPYKDSTKGTTNFTYTLSINSDTYGEDGKLSRSSAIKSKYWSYYDEKTGFNSSYSEDYYLDSRYADEKGKTRCNLWLEDKSYYYSYTWIKGQKTGTLWKDKKVTATPAPNTTPKPPVLEYVFYKDETVLGELCKVYSIKDITAGNDYNSISYYWLSTVTGKVIKYLYSNASDYGSYQGANTFFVDYRLNKPADFYTPPKDVKFTQESY